MDWIKVKTNHILYEYRDLRDSEFVAWIKIMALTAQLEHEPTRKQILQFVNYQTLDSLSEKLHTHSIDLSSILHKVLIDASDVRHMREYWKNKKREKRALENDVHVDVQEMSTSRLDKIREDKINNTNTPSTGKPSSAYSNSFLEFWQAYPKKIGKHEAWKLWRKRNDLPPVADLIVAIEKQKKTDQWGGGFIPNPATWINQRRWEDDPAAMEGGRNDRSGKGNATAGIGIPKEYIPEPAPEVSAEARERVRSLTAGLAAKWKAPDSPTD
jgi:hypothetical protein